MSEEIVLNDYPHWEKIVKVGKIKYMCSKCRKTVDGGETDIGLKNFCPYCGEKIVYIKI